VIDIKINEGPSFSLTDERARSLVSALAWVLEEPEVCRLRSTCTLYPQNKVVYHDEGAADPGVVVKVREE
jgi:hypothetical protein